MARLFMVLSSLSPLFVLLAIRGNAVLQDMWFVTGCALMTLLPNGFLWLRIARARNDNDVRQLVAGVSEDHRGHVLVYLFAILLPFYQHELESVRDLAAMCIALIFIVYIFWYLNLHYMNFVFALFNYKVFTISSPQDQNPHTGREPFVLITHRRTVLPGDHIVAYRLSDTVYLERDNAS